MTRRTAQALAIFLSLGMIHLSLYAVVCWKHYFGYGILWNAVWMVSNSPWLLLGKAGAPVVAGPEALPPHTPAIMQVFAALAIRPNELGATACVLIWLIFYWIVASSIARALPVRSMPRSK